MRKPIPGYEKYEADDEGRIWRVGAPRNRPLAPATVARYYRVSLHKDGKLKAFFVHQLVLLAFDGPCPAGMQVMHKNGVCTDNRLENLSYGTAKENSADRFRHGNWRNYGDTAYQAKLTEEKVREIKALSDWRPNDLARRYGVSCAAISLIRSGKNWKYVK
jgi:hypothetical protein